MSHGHAHTPRVKAAAEDAQDSITDAVTGVQDAVMKRAKDFSDNVGSSVKDNPWRSVGIALGVGVLIGLMIRK